MTVKELCKHLMAYVKLTIALDDEEYATDVITILGSDDNISIMLSQAHIDFFEPVDRNELYIYAY